MPQKTAGADRMIVKKVRPWVRLSLGLSALALSYGLVRQCNLIKDKVTVIEFDLRVIEA